MTQPDASYDIKIFPLTKWQWLMMRIRKMSPHWLRLIFSPMYRKLWRMIKEAQN